MSTKDYLKILSTELSEEDQKRIDEMRETKWIGYDRAVLIRHKMDALFRHPKSHRPPNMSLVGETNNGKTMLLENFFRRHNPPPIPSAEKTILPVLYVLSPPEPSEQRLYYAILDALGAATSANEKPDSMLKRLTTIFKNLEVRVLLLDDFYNTAAGTPAQRKKLLNALRNLSQKLRGPIIVAGTPEILNTLPVDKSIINRFKPLYLPKWTENDMEELASFVMTVEKLLLLKKPCDLMNDQALTNLLILGEGLLGEMVGILQHLAEIAIRTGEETITPSMLTMEFLKNTGWVISSKRAMYVT